MIAARWAWLVLWAAAPSPPPITPADPAEPPAPSDTAATAADERRTPERRTGTSPPGAAFPDPFSPPVGSPSYEALSDEERRVLEMERFAAYMEEGRLALKERRYDAAEDAFSRALGVVPGDPEALAGRAHARKARTPSKRCPRRAIADLLMLQTYDPRGRWLAERGTAYRWMQVCAGVFDDDRLALAEELAEAPADDPGRPPDVRWDVARMLLARAEKSTGGKARAALRRRALDQLELYRKETAARSEPMAPDALRTLAELHHDFGAIDEALEAYRAYAATQRGAARDDAERIVARLEDEKTLLEWEEIYGGRPTAEGEAAFAAGMDALEAGDLRRAEVAFDQAIALSEWYPRAWYMRGLVRARLGKYARAAEDLERATRLDRTFFEAYLKLGLLYKEEFGGTRDEEARNALEAALRLRPDLHPIHLLLGELYARVDRDVARGHLQAYLQHAPPDDPDAARARQILDELDRDPRRDAAAWVSPPPEESLRFLDPTLQRLINEAYLKVQQGNWDRAEAILQEARKRFPREPVVLNQLAQVMYARERKDEARDFWQASLAIDPDQVLVHEQLGFLLREEDPAGAFEHLQAAADLGSLRARFALARTLWEENEWLEAKAALDAYFAHADKYDLYWRQAEALRERIRRATIYASTTGVAVFAIVVGVPAVRLYRRYRGVSLRRFLDRHPKSFPEVARVLSLIRHEILKHNTAFLADVGRSIAASDPAAADRARVLVRRLFGGGKGASGGAGIYGRFLGYVEELRKVARAYGERLNLRRKDPIFRSMLDAFERLAEAADELRRVETLRPSRRQELAALLEGAGDVLGRRAFERLSELIRSMSTVVVDAAFVRRVFDQVRNEDAFRGIDVAPLEVRGEGARVRIFATDVEDILVNVLRNSLDASLRYCAPPAELAVELCTEVDDITGHTSLAIRIKDRSPERLSNEMLRGRYVERGMGITVDLLSRYDGSIAVEDEPGWAKAVVLRFFVLEETMGGEPAAEAARRMAS